MKRHRKQLLIGSDSRRTLIRAALIVVVTVVVFRFVLLPMRVEGESMKPTYSHGQVSIANRLAYLNAGPQRGDIVAVKMRDSGRSVFLLKRVVGLPGESIGFENGRLTVDGLSRDEDYLADESDWNREPVLCEPDEFFVVGDNRSMPIEFHIFGRARSTRIAGKVLF